MAISKSGEISYRSGDIAAPADGYLDNGCAYSGYTPIAHKWFSTYHYYIGQNNHPAAVTDAQWVSIVQGSVTNITQANNDCGRADYIDATRIYDGRTATKVNIDNVPNCGSNDGINVIDAGPLAPTNYLGVTCTWWSGSQLTSADIKIDTTGTTWTNTPGSCSGAYDIESVVTHEAGHAFGAEHDSNASAAYQTMYPYTTACTSWERTLGLGDMLALESVY